MRTTYCLHPIHPSTPLHPTPHTPHPPMYSQTHYLLRSRQDGQYLVARARLDEADPDATPIQFLLLFGEHADALSYVNTHAGEASDRFSVESIPGSQLAGLLKRWAFQGVGLVKDPLIPTIEFLTLA